MSEHVLHNDDDDDDDVETSCLKMEIHSTFFIYNASTIYIR